jgi:mannose-6-phosphate isomerase-like protein (cupin superfamily)
MLNTASTSSQPGSAIPADDLNRSLTVAEPDGTQVRHISLVGDTYMILVSGTQTAGRYCLIDMLVPDGSGSPPHRHDFEEMFSLRDGELEFSFRDKTHTVKAPATVNIPANAPHQFTNRSGRTAHMLCMCTPPGQEEFFMAGRERLSPTISKEEQAANGKLAQELAPKYRTEMLKHA